MNKFKKGFTLIELLVVIAIIGILAAVVLASLSSSRTKSKDAKVQSQMLSFRDAAELYYHTNETFAIDPDTNSVCNPTAEDKSGLRALLDGNNYPDSNPPSCEADGTTWVAWHALISDPSKAWCVDSDGASKAITGGTPVGSCAQVSNVGV